MTSDAKKIFLETEGDAWFKRCGSRPYEEYQSRGAKFLDAFLSKLGPHRWRILEIGCSSGYNLAYLCQKYGFEGFGIEPSARAVQAGSEWVAAHPDVDLHLVQGTSDELPFEDANV